MYNKNEMVVWKQSKEAVRGTDYVHSLALRSGHVVKSPSISVSLQFQRHAELFVQYQRALHHHVLILSGP